MRLPGSSLIELLVAMSLSAIAIGGGITVVTTLLRQANTAGRVRAELTLSSRLAATS